MRWLVIIAYIVVIFVVQYLLVNNMKECEYQRGFGMGEQHMLNELMKERAK